MSIKFFLSSLRRLKEKKYSKKSSALTKRQEYGHLARCYIKSAPYKRFVN